MKRTFWFLVGVAAAVYAIRVLRRTRDRYAPSAVAGRAADGMRDLGSQVRASVEEGLRGMAEKEAEIRASLSDLDERA